MFITIINDCKDDNAKGRQQTRIESLTGRPVAFVGVDSDLEAGIQLIDMLDAAEGREGLILVNCAPRGGSGKQFENGTPFCYFTIGKSLVVSTVAGYALSGVKQFNLLNEVALLDTNATTQALLAAGAIGEHEAAYIPESQFRSFDFSPRVGAYILAGGKLPHEICSVEDVPALPPAIWHVDSFGNCKTTLLPKDVNVSGDTETRFGPLTYFEHLHDVPQGARGFVRGSSGYQGTRFLELMSQGKNFADHHHVGIGDGIFGEDHFGERAT